MYVGVCVLVVDDECDGCDDDCVVWMCELVCVVEVVEI